jgi:hypothetical protein
MYPLDLTHGYFSCVHAPTADSINEILGKINCRRKKNLRHMRIWRTLLSVRKRKGNKKTSSFWCDHNTFKPFIPPFRCSKKNKTKQNKNKK